MTDTTPKRPRLSDEANTNMREGDGADGVVDGNHTKENDDDQAEDMDMENAHSTIVPNVEDDKINWSSTETVNFYNHVWKPMPKDAEGIVMRRTLLLTSYDLVKSHLEIKSEWSRFHLNLALTEENEVVLVTPKDESTSESGEDAQAEIIRSQLTGLSEPMVHVKDVEKLLQTMNEVHKWHNDQTLQAKYIAPILPVVQSSGTGKSKLLYALRAHLQKSNAQIACASILCVGASEEAPQGWEDFYDAIYKVGETFQNGGVETLRAEKEELRKIVFGVCNRRLTAMGEHAPKDVFLLVDESHHLLHSKHTPGFLFRVLRWITREKPELRSVEEGGLPGVKLTVAASGTNSALGNCYPETEEKSTRSTRYYKTINYFINSDQEDAVPYDPYHCLRTVGCISTWKQVDWDRTGLRNEYERSVPYGRPLFAVMLKKKLLAAFEKTALVRMVLGKVTLEGDVVGVSVLGTRVQMGSTTSAVVSELVARGYAHLTGFHRHKAIYGTFLTARFAYLPDPVCARLAMKLMDEGCSLPFETHELGSSTKGVQSGYLRGLPKKEWAKRLGDIHRSKLCQPDKGDIGETAIALYLLFCGDVLRKIVDPEYNTFSVALADWLCKLNDSAGAGKFQPTQSLTSGANVEEDADESDQYVLTTNCIQFYRHSVRVPLAQYSSQEFLKWHYEAACGIYGPVNFPAFDKVLPIKAVRQSDMTVSHHPMFVSAKNYFYASPGVVRGFQIASIETLVDKGVTTGLFLLVIVGQPKISKNYVNVLGDQESSDLTMFQSVGKVSEKPATKQARLALNAKMKQVLSDDPTLVHSKLVPKVLCIGPGDCFGIDAAVKAANPEGDKLSDVYESHASLSCLGQGVYGDVTGLTNGTEKILMMDTIGAFSSSVDDGQGGQDESN